MNWIASSEKEFVTDPFHADCGGDAARSIQPALGLTFPRFAEVRIAKQRATLKRASAKDGNSHIPGRGSRVNEPASDQDHALEATKAKVLETEHTLKEKGQENRHGQLCRAAGYAFYNTSHFNYESLHHDDANLSLNLRQYVMGFSPNVREIFAAFNFDDAIRDLERAGVNKG